MDRSKEGKRKGAPQEHNGGPPKRKKGGNDGRWKTPSHEARTSKPQPGGSIEPGDVGIWATCARHMEGRSARELKELLDEYVEKMYGIKTTDPGEDADEDEDGDILSSLNKELASLKDRDQGDSGQVISEVRVKEDCLLFMKTKPPVDPVALVKHICQDAQACADPKSRKTRYVNRLTPVTAIGKATEASIQNIATEVLAPHFELDNKGPKETQSEDGSEPPPSGEGGTGKVKPAYKYAIRLSNRNHNTLKRDDVIKRIASLIDTRHKVDLGAPDKVILVDIYQTICGMSVVDGDWNELKKYNMTELYNQAVKSSQQTSE